MATEYCTHHNCATTAELAEELQKAHSIIRIALACLEGEARGVFMDEVCAARLDGEGITRANERQTLLERVACAPTRVNEAARGQLLALVRQMWPAELALAKPDLRVVPGAIKVGQQIDTDDDSAFGAARPLPTGPAAPRRVSKRSQNDNQSAAEERAFNASRMTSLKAFIRKELGASPVKPKLHILKP